MPADRPPPRIVVVSVLAALALLLVYPLHRRYQYPEQDVPMVAALREFVRRDVVPTVVIYPSALTNLLRLGDEALYAVGRPAGWYRDRLDVFKAWARAPWRFRLPARLLAALGGVLALVAVRRAAAVVVPGWEALVAPLVLGTSLMFVREFHLGMWDAPAAAAAMLALDGLTRWLDRPRGATLAGAAVAAALAVGFKYNLAVVALAVGAAILAAPASVGRARSLAVALGVGLVALVVAMPVVVLDPARLVRELGLLAPRQIDILSRAAPPEGHGVAAALGLAFGRVASALALGGLALAALRRERRLVPLGVFVVAYAGLLAGTPLVLNRYALPLAPPLAVFAAYAVAALPARALRAAVAAFVVALGLPACLAHLRLLATEDTRVTAATWITARAAEGARICLAGNAGNAMYAGPDLPVPMRFEGMTPSAGPEVDADTGVPRWAFFEPRPGAPGDARRLLPCAGGLVVTSEHPSPAFARVSTPPDTLALLGMHTAVVLDLPIERVGDPSRIYEPFDLQYVPFTGLETLARPGPRIRVWSVPGAVVLGQP